jgi:hypothetical protein
MKSQGQIFVIFSVDAEKDIISTYHTKTTGWTTGVPLLFDVFDALDMQGKVCWLVEFNLRDNILAANPKSEYFVKEFTGLITQIKGRNDELGIHPDVYDWLGAGKDLSAVPYNDASLWDFNRSHSDPEFVKDLITSATNEFRAACQTQPIGCRTGAFHYATHLAEALGSNGIKVDSSASRGLSHWLAAPNAYYAAMDNIWHEAPEKAGVLEIPTTGYICRLFDLPLRLRTWYLACQKKPIFLSFFVHSWQAITIDGKPDERFLGILVSFLRMLKNRGARFLSWTEAYEVYAEMYNNTDDCYC